MLLHVHSEVLVAACGCQAVYPSVEHGGRGAPVAIASCWAWENCVREREQRLSRGRGGLSLSSACSPRLRRGAGQLPLPWPSSITEASANQFYLRLQGLAMAERHGL